MGSVNVRESCAALVIELELSLAVGLVDARLVTVCECVHKASQQCGLAWRYDAGQSTTRRKVVVRCINAGLSHY